MAPLVTVVIPIGTYHKHLAERAIDSAIWQTVDCAVIALDSFPTPAIVRNTPVQTPFTIWLDADDWLAPTFAEECLSVYNPKRPYVYTSWYCDDVIRKPVYCKRDDYQSHLVTTLYPSAIFQALGGFDASLPAHEDVDFYLRSQAAGVCGVYLDKPLVHYSDNGQRSRDFRANPAKDRIMMDVLYRNGGEETLMGCCGEPGIQAKVNPGEPQEGDILATALWTGMHTEVGHVTGRLYSGGNGGQIWVSPADVQRMPHLFRPAQDLKKLAPDREQVLKEAGLA